MLDGQQRLRLVDFGAAEEVSPVGAGYRVQVEGARPNRPSRRVSSIQGTPGYMSPEALTVAAANTGDFDALAADMWSVGVTLYCLFNGGALPFTGRDIHELRRKVVGTEPPLAKCMHADRQPTGLCAMLMAKSPLRRPTAEQAQRHAWIAMAATSAMLRARAYETQMEI